MVGVLPRWETDPFRQPQADPPATVFGVPAGGLGRAHADTVGVTDPRRSWSERAAKAFMLPLAPRCGSPLPRPAGRTASKLHMNAPNAAAACPTCRFAHLVTGVRRVSSTVDGHTFVAELPCTGCSQCGHYRIGRAPLRRFHLLVAEQLLAAGERDGSVLRYAREALGLERADLARRLNISAAELDAWEARSFVYRTALEIAGELVKAELDEDGRPGTFILGARPLAPSIRVEWMHEGASARRMVG